MSLLIVEPIGSAVLRWLESRHPIRFVPEAASNPAGLRLLLSDVTAVVLPPSVRVDGAWLDAAPRLRAIGRVSGGAENIDLEACRRARVEVVRSPASTDTAEAEFVIGALLSMLRRVPVIDIDGMPVGRELGAATVGLLGVSPASEAVVRRLSVFGCRVIGYDPGLHADAALYQALNVRPVGIQQLFAKSDAVSVQLGDYSRYQGLIGGRLLEGARPDQVIVSLARSTVFDEAALARALTDGPLAAVWLDSLEPGARDPGRPLHRIDRLQTTPRVAETTRESRLRSAWAVARRIDELLGPAASTAAAVRPPAATGPAADAGGPEAG